MTVPAGLMDAFWDYERALMADDVAALDRLFATGPDTLRGDAAGLLVGHDRISAFRGSRGGAPARRIVETHVQAAGPDAALVVAVTELARGGRGQQTQLWTRRGGRWAVTAAHVSVPPPAVDTRVWRAVGDPLVHGSGAGSLAGESVAVKDLYAVAGHRVGAGNPAWLAGAAAEQRTAPVVQALLDAGADVRGIARTDELAYSLAGTNAHYGAPPNPRAPYRVPGGSSSGCASAVALGHASVGLGTDTGGSVRVPASYQGLFGLRTTHGLLSREGLLALSPSFDTVGWLARDARRLDAVGDVLLPTSPGGSRDLVVVPDLVGLADPDVAASVTSYAERHGAAVEQWDVRGHDEWLGAFLTLQAWEAWREHGGWLTGRLGSVGADVRARFEHAATVTDEQAASASAVVATARDTIRGLVGDRVLVLPSASSVAPPLGEGLQAVRAATMRLTCLAGLAGLPALSVPVETGADLPRGACLVAAAGRDRDLLALAVELAS